MKPNQDSEHLQLLSVFHYVLAVVTAIFSLFPLIHLSIGIAIVSGSLEEMAPNGEGIPRQFGWLFIGIATFLITIGLVSAASMAIAGRCLKRHRQHTFCVVVAAVECFFVPFGTVLGVFSLVVLLRPSVKTLFEKSDG